MPELNTRKGKYIFLCLRIAVVAGGIAWAVFWISREQRWTNLKAVFHEMNMGIFSLTLGIFILCEVVIGLRWWLLLRVQSIFINLWVAVKLYFLGWFYNNFMPSSVGGDLVRAWYITKHTDKKFEAVLSVFADRVIGLLSTLAIAAFFYGLFFVGQGRKIDLAGEPSSLTFLCRYSSVIFYIFLTLTAILGVFLLNHRTRKILWGVWSYLYIRIRAVFEKFINAVKIYCQKPLILLTVFALTIGAQLVVLTGFWILGVHIGVDTGIAYYYVFFPLMWIVATLPVSIGGIVVMEGGLAYLFVHFTGAEPEAALALALCHRVVWMMASVPGALIHVIGAHLPGDFFIDSNERIA